MDDSAARHLFTHRIRNAPGNDNHHLKAAVEAFATQAMRTSLLDILPQRRISLHCPEHQNILHALSYLQRHCEAITHEGNEMSEEQLDMQKLVGDLKRLLRALARAQSGEPMRRIDWKALKDGVETLQIIGEKLIHHLRLDRQAYDQLDEQVGAHHDHYRSMLHALRWELYRRAYNDSRGENIVNILPLLDLPVQEKALQQRHVDERKLSDQVESDRDGIYRRIERGAILAIECDHWSTLLKNVAKEASVMLKEQQTTPTR